MSFIRISAAALAGFLPAVALAQDACGVCNETVAVDQALATCFLDQYQQFESKGGGVIVVDLSGCPVETGRDLTGVISPLAPPGGAAEVAEPDLTFMVTKGQLACLKAKLEEPGMVIEKVVTIDLAGCG